MLPNYRLARAQHDAALREAAARRRAAIGAERRARCRQRVWGLPIGPACQPSATVC